MSERAAVTLESLVGEHVLTGVGKPPPIAHPTRTGDRPEMTEQAPMTPAKEKA